MKINSFVNWKAFIIIPLISTVYFQGTIAFAAGLALSLGFLLIYGAAKTIAKHPIHALASALALTLLLSFITWPSIVLTTLVILSIMRLIQKRAAAAELFSFERSAFQSLSSFDKITLLALFSLLSCIGIYTNEGFYAHDAFHRIYEASIGQSFGHALINTPDLSNIEKTVRYHFATTRLPIMLSGLTTLPLLQSIFFLSPLLSFLFLMLSIVFFMQKHPSCRMPLLVFFSFPIFGGSFITQTSMLSQTVLYSTSYSLATGLIILGTAYLIEGQAIALCLLSIFLFLSKASYFFVFWGGVGLYMAARREWRKLLVSTAALTLANGVFYFLFLKGAHSQDHWILMPHHLYFNLGILNKGQFFLLIPLLCLTAYIATIRYKMPEERLAIASCALSGLIGITLLTEITSTNSFQFIIAAAPFTAMILWNVYIKDEFRLTLWSRFAKGIMIILVFSGVISNGKDALVYAVKPWAQKEGVSFSLSKRFDRYASARQLISKDVIEGYDFLNKNASHNAVVLYGRHYDYSLSFAKGYDPNWVWHNVGFLRSTLSNRQMFCEEFRNRGIGMEESFPRRFAQSLAFFNEFVLPSKSSQRLLSIFYAMKPLDKEGESFAYKTNFMDRLIYRLGLNKEWSWLNRSHYLISEISTNLHVLKPPSLDFFKDRKITYLVLEHGDQLKEDLTSEFAKIFQNNELTIYRMR